MEKQKLAELVMQKMKEKKELEERNRPHYEVLRLEATFAKELNDCLKLEISALEAQLGSEESRLLELQNHLQVSAAPLRNWTTAARRASPG